MCQALKYLPKPVYHHGLRELSILPLLLTYRPALRKQALKIPVAGKWLNQKQDITCVV
jgi:hypothetical protein